MRTLFIVLRAVLFGTGFVFLWGWVARALHCRYDTARGLVLSGW